MRKDLKPGDSGRGVLPVLCLAILGLALGGCRHIRSTDMSPLDKAGMYFNSVEQLRQLGVNDAEVQQLVAARQGGVSDRACIELVRIAHGRHQPFSTASVVVGLIQAGLQENTVIELARLNQLALWAGEAQAMKLAGLSDSVILAVARRRAAHQPVLSGSKVAELQNAGLSETQLLAEVDRGISDSQADAIITQRTNAAGGHYFVRQTRRRRR
jgi:hypothetical protein